MAKLFIEVSVSGCSSPSLALPRCLISCHAYCIASKHHDRLQTLSISLRCRRYTHDMLWIPPNQAPGSGSSHTSSCKPSLKKTVSRTRFSARKVRRLEESEESQTSCVLWLQIQIASGTEWRQYSSLSPTSTKKTKLFRYIVNIMSNMRLPPSCGYVSQCCGTDHNPESPMRHYVPSLHKEKSRTHRSYATGSLRPWRISSTFRYSGSASS